MRYEIKGRLHGNVFIVIKEAESEEELDKLIKKSYPEARDIEVKVL